MSHKLINLNPDLKRLRDEGYVLEIRGAFLLVHQVPHVNAGKQIALGVLVSSLTLAGDNVGPPGDHVISFIGQYPCNFDGSPITALRHSGAQVLDAAHGITVDHSFSNRPKDGFTNHYDKVTSYVRVISSQAQAIDEKVTAKTFGVIEDMDDESIFNYVDTNSSRGGIVNIAAKADKEKVAIVGLGGTGAYVLDFVAKTPTKEIHLFDGDVFYSHNAFRAPSAPTLEQLNSKVMKVHYFHAVYSRMHKGIFPHEAYLTPANWELLASMNFVFLCIDDGPAKKLIVARLVELKVPFADVGIGVQVVDGALTGSVRVTTVTASKHDHVDTRISFAEDAENDYVKNIQIAELNALNATLAVVKWKKLLGVYHDLAKEHNAVYDINVNTLINDETHP